ncbi:hypothetical protein EBZ38_00355 [bacterium]|nr:hypothetical protein [bacterium]NDC94035.1 hypothetical protein [bacterium]NDD82721.1 hypothetical protein [bacterium]
MYKTDSTLTETSSVKKLIATYAKAHSDTDSVESDTKVNCLCCESNHNTPFIILSCNHTYHIVCLAETQLSDVYKYPTIDSDYSQTRTCKMCQKPLETEELIFLHSKYLNTTKGHIQTHNDNVARLESQLANIKSELRVCYEYVHKLEAQREKSKQIIGVLSTHI